MELNGGDGGFQVGYVAPPHANDHDSTSEHQALHSRSVGTTILGSCMLLAVNIWRSIGWNL